MYISSFSSLFTWYAQQPMALWIHSLSYTEAQQEYQQAEGLLFSRQECRQAEEFIRTFWQEIGQFCAATSKPSKDHQEQASTSLHANHWRQKFLFEDPKVLLAAELGPWPWRLQGQSHGASARVPSQQGAQSDRWQRPRQLVNIGLDSSNKTEAACLIKASSKPTSLAFLVGTAVPPRCAQIFLGTSGKWNCAKELAKIKFCCTGVYVHL